MLKVTLNKLIAHLNAVLAQVVMTAAHAHATVVVVAAAMAAVAAATVVLLLLLLVLLDQLLIKLQLLLEMLAIN